MKIISDPRFYIETSYFQVFAWLVSENESCFRLSLGLLTPYFPILQLTSNLRLAGAFHLTPHIGIFGELISHLGDPP